MQSYFPGYMHSFVGAVTTRQVAGEDVEEYTLDVAVYFDYSWYGLTSFKKAVLNFKIARHSQVNKVDQNTKFFGQTNVEQSFLFPPYL